MQQFRIVLVFILVSTFVMSAFSKVSEAEAEKAKQQEEDRLCAIYTKKLDMYKKTMRSDPFALDSYDNYKEKQDKYCLSAEQNTTEQNQTVQ